MDETHAREMAAKESREIAMRSLATPKHIPDAPKGINDTYVSLMRDSVFDIDPLEEDEEEEVKSFEYLEDYYEQRQKAFDFGEDDTWVYVEDDNDDDDYFQVRRKYPYITVKTDMISTQG